MKLIVYTLLFLNHLGFAQNKIGLTQQEITKIYNEIEYETIIDEKGEKVLMLSTNEYNMLFAFDNNGFCYSENQKPLNKNSGERLMNFLKSHEQIDENTWIICNYCKTNLGLGEIIAVYKDGFVSYTNPKQFGLSSLSFKKKTDKKSEIFISKSDEYDAYEILEFAKKIKFKPKFASFETIKDVLLQLDNDEIKQLNIGAMYNCEVKYLTTKKQYIEQYGFVEDDFLKEYCSIFHILMIIDNIAR